MNLHRTCQFVLLVMLALSSDLMAASAGDPQTVTLSQGAALTGTAPAGHAVEWAVKTRPAAGACNFPTSGPNDVPAKTTQNPTRAEFSRTGTYVLTFTDTSDSSSADLTITVVANSAGNGTVSKSRVVRIMPLGDSITAATGGWRFPLQDKLTAGGYQFDFVGGRHLDRSGSYDPDHEGHSGWETSNYPQSQEFGWGIDNSGYVIDAAGLQPDVVLLMLGTNDAGRGSLTSEQSAARLFQIVDDVLTKVSASRLIIAKIPRRTERDGGASAPGGVTVDAWVQDYNARIGSTVSTRAAAGQKLSVVDMYTAIAQADLSDGVHFAATANTKAAQVWYDGIVAVTTGGGGGGGGNQAPTCSVSIPAGSFSAPATVNLSAAASDSDGSITKVEFFAGATKLGEDMSAPYDYSWTNIAAGSFSVTAKATDNQGASTTSAAISLLVSAAGGGLPAGNGEHNGQIGSEPYWLPDVQTIRGMLISSMGEPEKALGRKWGFGIFYVGMFSTKNAPNNFPQIGAATGHPELASTTPFIATGLSTGAGFVAKMAELYPQQMIAFVSWNTAFSYALGNDGWNWNRPTDMDAEKVSIVDLNVAKGVPGIFVMSENDGLVGVTVGQGLFTAGRRVDAPWTYVVLAGMGHTGYILPSPIIDWSDAVLANRYPIGSPLGVVNRSGDWYGNVVSKVTAASASFTGDKQTASWLPNATWASAWVGLTKGLPYVLPAVRAKTLPHGIIDESSIQINETMANLPVNARLWPSTSAGVGPWDYENANPTAQQHASGKGGRWKLCADLDVGDQITPTVLPNATVVTGLPASVRGCDYLRPAQPVADGNATIASFRLAQAATVTIALDSRVATPPAWMAGFTQVAGETITVFDGTTAFENPRVMNLFRRSLPANATVTLGGSGADNVLMYLVIVKASGPQANLAPTVSPGANQAATLVGGSATVTLNAAISDDGQVQANPTLTWSSAPSTGVSFANSQTASTTATFTAAGTYTLTLSAFDGALTGSGTLTVTVSAAGSNQPPTVNLIAPSNGAYATAPATIQLTATASDADGSVTKVEFFNGATKLGEDTSAPYSFAWSNVVAGTYQLTAKATDNLGATATSTVATVNVGTDIVLQAESYSAKKAMTDGGALMGGGTTGSWLRFDGVPLASATYLRFSVSYQGNGDTGVPITVRSGTSSGTVLATLTTAATSGSTFSTQSVAFTSPGIAQTLYVVFGSGSGAAYYDWFRIDTVAPPASAPASVPVSNAAPATNSGCGIGSAVGLMGLVCYLSRFWRQSSDPDADTPKRT